MFVICNLFVIIILIAIVVLLTHVRKRSRHPPGPLGLPYVGLLPFRIVNILFSGFFPMISQKTYFRNMREKYGDIWSVEVGCQRVVTIASFELIEEAFVKNGNIFAGKPISEPFNIISEGQGILLIDGELWRDNRQMAVKAFHDLGVEKSDLENHICTEANFLIEYLANLSKSPLNSTVDFIHAESNIISKLLFDETNKYDDPEFEVFFKNLKVAYQSDVIETRCCFFPDCLKTTLARYIFPDVDKYYKAWTDIVSFVEKKCQKRRCKQGEITAPSCVFDYFWKYRYVDEQGVDYERKILEIAHSMSDLYTSGTDTTNTLLRFCCLMLGRYPEVQKDLRNEIKTTTVNYKLINMNIKNGFPKLLSFIDEIQRFCCLLPKFYRRVMRPCTFKGYKLHVKDIVIGDWGTITRDQALFENPDKFDAYRFMDGSRTQYVPSRFMVPFGIGKRSCVGETIAAMELYLFLSRLILAFDISLPKDTLDNFENIIEGKSGFTHAPLDHGIKLHFLYSQ